MTSKDRTISIRDLYPEFTEQQLEEAEANLRAYLSVLINMAERLHSEGRSILDLEADELTDSHPGTTVQDERSKLTN